MGHIRSPPATRNRDSAKSTWGRSPGSVSIVVRAATRAVKRDDSWHYRTSARASERSWQKLHNSPAAGSKNRQPVASGDSPRHCCASRNRRLGAGGPALGSGTPELAGGTFLVRSPDNGSWLSVAASGGQPHGSSKCNNGRTGATAERSAHNPSKDRRDAPDARGRLAPIATLGKAEMGSRGVTAPYWSSLVAKRQLRSEAFLFLAAPPSCGCTNPPG
jgi:hypothetical protein